MEQSKITTLGSFAAAILASLCCIGPVVVALVGVGSIGAFAVFEAYRPFLVGLTVLLLGLALYLVYRKREVVCEDGTCKIERASRWNKISVWLATVLAAVAIAFPYFDFTNAAAAETMLAQTQQNPRFAVTVLHIEGMDCLGCATGLETTLARIEGVQKAAVEFDSSRAVIEYELARVTPEKLIASIAETGFKAKVKLEKNPK